MVQHLASHLGFPLSILNMASMQPWDPREEGRENGLKDTCDSKKTGASSHSSTSLELMSHPPRALSAWLGAATYLPGASFY